MRELLEVLEKNSRISVSELASMFRKSEYEIEKEIARLEREKIILSYGALINWELSKLI